MKKLLLIVAAALGLFACNSQPEKSASAARPATGVYKDYLDLKNALVSSDAGSAKKNAEKLAAALSSAADSQQVKAHEAAIAIAASSSLDEQRKTFSGLSETLIGLARKGSLGDNSFFVQHCPMAFNNQGASWLSNEEEIRNPYFGDQMLECGEVKEEIR